MASATWTWIDPAEGGLVPYPFTVQYSNSAPGSDAMTWQRNLTTELQPIGITGSSPQLPFLFEGMSSPIQLVLQGLFLAEVQQLTFLEFYLLAHTTYLTDDRGMIRNIYPTELVYTRIPNALYQWKTTFQLTATVLSVTYP